MQNAECGTLNAEQGPGRMSALVYVQRPDGTALWLPPELMGRIGAAHGVRLSAVQFADAGVRALLAARERAQAEGGSRKGAKAAKGKGAQG